VDASWDHVDEDTITSLPITAWSQWERQSFPIIGERWIRYRKREVHEHEVVSHWRQSCRLQCPPGTELRTSGGPGGPCVDWGAPTTGGHDYRSGYPMMHVRSGPNQTGTSTYDYTWTEIEAESKPYPPWFETLQRILSDGPPAPHARASAARKSGKRPAIEGIALPPLYDGDRLILGNSRSPYSVTVDDREQSPGRAIVASQLAPGQHTDRGNCASTQQTTP